MSTFVQQLYTTLLRVGQPGVYRHFQAYKQRQYLPRPELEALQLERMQRIVRHAYENTALYRAKYDAAGVHPNDLQRLEDIRLFPTVTKHELKQAIADGDLAPTTEKTKTLATTGSSGVPFRFPMNKDAQDDRMGCMLRTIEWYGHLLGVKNVRFWRTSNKKGLGARLKQNVFGRRLELSIYNVDDPEGSVLDENKMRSHFDAIARYKPVVIDGYVSSFVYMSRYIIDNALTVYSPTSIVTGAEYLSPESRALIEEAFGCPVYDRYGGTEIGLMAHECEEKNLHWMADKAYPELIVDGAPAAPGEMGKIICTDFTSMVIPFIRYEVGDMGVAEDPATVCACGRSLPLLRAVEGRINDLMPLRDGGVLVTHLWFKLFREFQQVKQFQVVQEDYDLFRITVVLEKEDASIDELQRQVESFIPGASVQWEVVDRIIPGKGGKLRHTISHVPFELNQMRDTALRNESVRRVEVEQLRPHEEVDAEYVVQLSETIERDGLVRKPILVDKESRLIIDGHHRYTVAKRHNWKRIPAVEVDYFDDQFILSSPTIDGLTKKAVVQQAMSGTVYPKKTTKHVYGEHELPIVQCLPESNTPIDELQQ